MNKTYSLNLHLESLLVPDGPTQALNAPDSQQNSQQALLVQIEQSYPRSAPVIAVEKSNPERAPGIVVEKPSPHVQFLSRLKAFFAGGAQETRGKIDHHSGGCIQLNSQRAQLLTIRIGEGDDRALCILYATRGEDSGGRCNVLLELQVHPGFSGHFKSVRLTARFQDPEDGTQIPISDYQPIGTNVGDDASLEFLDFKAYNVTSCYDALTVYWVLSRNKLAASRGVGMRQLFCLQLKNTSRVEASLRLACHYNMGTLHRNVRCSAPEGNDFFDCIFEFAQTENKEVVVKKKAKRRTGRTGESGRAVTGENGA